MKIAPDKPWSTGMKIALVALSLMGALVLVSSVAGMVHTLKSGGAVEVMVGVRALAGGVWALFALLLMKHPEWKRYLAQKF